MVFLMLLSGALSAQDAGEIRGRVYNSINNEPVPFASILLQGTALGTPSDAEGFFSVKNLKPGEYNLVVSAVGFKSLVVPEVRVQNFKPTVVDIRIEEETGALQEVEVVQKALPQTAESPLSLRTIGIAEVQRNPGGNRDVSNALQSLPGVSTNVSFRNDIIIRGGSPNENRFYLDGIEVPNIYHFATQGGPVGLIIVNFIRQLDFYSGAFPANQGNALSTVIECEH